MNRIWAKAREKVKQLFSKTKEDKKDYLTNLLNKLEDAQQQNKALPFTIKKATKKGFVVKIGGIFAFLSFNYMPWKYTNYSNWQHVARHLIGKRFFGTIHTIDSEKKPVSIIVNAENHIFKNFKLTEATQYSAIIIQKAKYGLFVDLGYHFDWKYGSFVGLIHKSIFAENKDLLNAKEGDITQIYFHGYKEEGKMMLGNKDYQKGWFDGELDAYINTVQIATIKENENGKKIYYINEKYKTTMKIPTKYLEKNKEFKNKIFNNLPINTKVECKIIAISKKKWFISELTDNAIKNLENQSTKNKIKPPHTL